MFKILKGIGVEQSSYHGGSLNGKDIKKVMDKADYLFDEFSSLLQAGKREGCELDNGCIDALCQHLSWYSLYGMEHFHWRGRRIPQRWTPSSTSFLSMLLCPSMWIDNHT